jgi:Prealbumin-like fold domain
MSKSRKVGAAGVLALAMSLLVVLPASALVISLPGSTFEIDDNANLVVDVAGNDDWVTIPTGTGPGEERRASDLPTGQGDNSFGQGTKEDTAVPTVVSGSIPNNKSDLLNFGAYLEENAAGKFLNIYWRRVQEPTGTTNMDFEFNKSSTISGNGVTPVRSSGDVLIQYDLTSGGTHPELFLSRWVTTGPGSQCQANNTTPCWGTRVNLSSAGDAVGSINTTPITNNPATPVDETDGLGSMSARTFGEAQIDFDAFAGTGACVNFGSAYLKSRSSDSFTAALKDFIAPITLNFSNCGTVHVIKKDDATPGNLLDGAGFDLVTDVPPLNEATGPGVGDTVVDSCVTVAGVCDFTEVVAGEYWVVETSAPPGYDLPDTVFQHVTVTADGTVEVTFIDPAQRGAIQVTKTAKQASDADGSINLDGVVFTIKGTDPAVTATTNADGIACFDDLAFGNYTIVETVPTDYAPGRDANGDPITEQDATVDNKAACADAPFVGEELTFDNVPLTDVTVSVDSLIPGGTASTISCDDGTTGSTDAITGDGSATASDLEPGTLVCTIVIDP